MARDLSKKVEVLQVYLNSAANSNYKTLKTMVEYEMMLGTVQNKGASASGTRTMLRLHWALEFFIEFMDQLEHATSNTKTSTLVYSIYQRTLALHHPWWTKKLAYLAVFTLPSIKNLIDIMCKQGYEEVKVLLSQIVNVGRPILRCTAQLYHVHNISEIP